MSRSDALDDAALLRQLDEVAQLGLGGERPLAEALAGGERVADDDEQPRERAEDAGQRERQAGAEQRDALGLLAADGARRDADEHVADDGHHGDAGDDAERAVDAVHAVRDDDARGGQLEQHAQQQEQVERPRRVGQHALEAARAGGAVADQLLDAHARHPRQRRLQAAEEAGQQHEADGRDEREDRGAGHEGDVIVARRIAPSHLLSDGVGTTTMLPALLLATIASCSSVGDVRRLLLLSAALPLLLTGCSSDASGSGSLQVTAGFYPYAWVAERVGGDGVEVVNLTEPGAEPHDLELSPRQVAGLGEADLVVYSQGFQPAVDEAVEQQAADRALDVLEGADLLDGDDPHLWLDPVRLADVGDAVADRMAEAAPQSAQGFEQRAQELRTELEALDDELRAGLADCARRDLVTSHDAFGYLADAYDLVQVPITGLSPEAEASPQRLAEVARIAEERGVTTVFFEELVSPKVAESLAAEVGATATVLSPLEGPPEDGDYLSAMRTNLSSLRTALDCR